MRDKEQKIKSLWLCSWYPNKAQPQLGDFIQRHAFAASQYAKVYTLYVGAVAAGVIDGRRERSVHQSDNLTETFFLYTKKNERWYSKMRSALLYYCYTYKKIKKYIKEEGLPDIVHVNVAIRAGVAALWLKWRYQIPYVVSEHWTIYHSNHGRDYKNKNYFFRLFTRLIMRHAADVFVVSDHLGKVLQEITALAHYSIIPNVVDTTSFYYQPKAADDNVFRYIHVSSMFPEKRTQEIIAAFQLVRAKIPQAELVLIGGNSQFVVPESAGVRYLGEMGNPTVAQHVRSSYVFVLYSLFENMPCVLLEALSSGVPIISSNVGGVSEIISRDNGVLVDIKDKSQLEWAMIDMYENYDRYNRLKIAGVATAQYNYAVVGKQIFDKYIFTLKNNSIK